MPLHPEEVAELSHLLDEVLALDTTERDAWLANLQQTKPEAAKRLHTMLKQAEASDTGLLPKLPKADDEAVAAAGERVGPYVLIREIGRGGMGSVWLADRADGAFKRRLALKLPRLTWSAGLAKRMARERDIGALLEHPNIARLYDAGLDEHGRPYIAMEYIEGQPIDVYCREHALELRAKLQLFVSVAQAVTYAHGRLVLHRDLKPSNVLVDASGQPHLLDFGIAKLLDDPAGAELTQEQGRVLTLSYAAPEHIAGRPIGVTADVYALGVLLYELLTGTLPYTTKRQSPGALEDAILAGDAPPPSSRVAEARYARPLRGDLDAIVGKAIKRDPNERYQTAEALAADIQRYLDGHAIEARPDSAWYRLRKAVVRHRLPVLAAAAVTVVALVGLTATLMQGQRAADEAERARATTAFVSELFRVDAAQLIPLNAGVARPTQAILAERGAQLIEARFEKQPALKAELYGVVGRVYADLGQDRLANEFTTRQLQLLRAQQASAPQIARSLMLLSQAALAARRDADAEDYARRAVDILASDDDLRPDALACLARAELRNGKVERAAQTAAQARATLAEHATSKSTALAWLTYIDAGVLARQNRFDDAMPKYQQAIDEALKLEGPTSGAAIEMRLALAVGLINRNRSDDARQFGDAAIAALESLGGVYLIRAARAKAHLQVRMLDLQAASYEETVALLNKVFQYLQLQSAALPAEVLADIEFSIGTAHVMHGEYELAEPLVDSSVLILRTSSQSMYDKFMFASIVGMLKMAIGDHETADRNLRERMDNRIQSGEGNSPFAAIDWSFIASNLMMQGRYQEAEAFLLRAPTFSDDPGDKRAGYSRLLSETLAQIRLQAGDVQGARKALPTTLPEPSDTYGMWFEAYQVHGEVWCAAGESSRGLALLITAEQALSRVSSPNSPALARLRAAAGLCALAAGNRRQAEEFATQAKRAFQAQPRVSPYFKQALVRLERQLGAKPI
jgi:hypothetical protein